MQQNTNNKNNFKEKNTNNKKLNTNKRSFSNLPKNRSYDNLQITKRVEQEEDYMTINEFNKKYGNNIKDENIKELNLINFKLGNDIFDYLSKIKLEQLQLLYI